MAIIKELLFNDGEGLDVNDLNSLQRFLRSGFLDGIVRHLGRTSDGQFGGIGDTYSPNGAFPGLNVFGHHCAPLASATALRVDPRAGILMQSTGTPDGNDPKTLLYSATAAELQTLHTAGDGSNPRYDLVSVQLSHGNGDPESRDFEDGTTRVKSSTTPNKRRNVTLTKTLTVGTPAGSPTIPSTPANHVPLYAVLVPTSHSGVHLNTNIIDYRLPLGSYTVDVFAKDAYNRNAYSGSWNNTTGVAYGVTEAAASGAKLWLVPHMLKSVHSRLSAVSVVGSENSAASTYLLRRMFPLQGAGTSLLDMSGTDGLANSLRHSVVSGSTEAPNFDLLGLGHVVWANGYTSPEGNQYGAPAVNGTSRIALEIESGANLDAWVMARFHFIGGL